VQVPIQHIDAAINLLARNDQRRRDDEVAYPSLDNDTIAQRLCRDLVDKQWLAGNLVRISVERLPCFLVLHQIDAPEESAPAHIAHARVLRLEFR
jgi:hypothetical protein